MREIRFRAWDTENKCMRNNVAVGLGMVEYDLSCHQSVEIMIPMQFTGLFDKNGKEIYEGDILNMTYHGSVSIVKPEIKDVVGFERGCFIVKETGFALGKIGRSLEVIGNIYENPTLLESENDNGK